MFYAYPLCLAPVRVGLQSQLSFGKDVAGGKVFPSPKVVENPTVDTCDSPYIFPATLLRSVPVFASPDFLRPFKLEINASGHRTGALMLQEDVRGVDRPLCFFKKFYKHRERSASLTPGPSTLRGLCLLLLCVQSTIPKCSCPKCATTTTTSV